MALDMFTSLVIILIFLALVLQLVPLIINAFQRRSEEARIERVLKEQKTTGTKPEDLSIAFKAIQQSVSPTPVTRSTLSILPIVVVGIAIFFLIVTNRDMVLVASNNTTINGTISTAVTSSNSLINTLLGVLAGFLTAAAGFYFGAKATATSSATGTKDVSKQLKTLSELHDKHKLSDDEYEQAKKKLIESL